jgi:hypothetical protein
MYSIYSVCSLQLLLPVRTQKAVAVAEEVVAVAACSRSLLHRRTNLVAVAAEVVVAVWRLARGHCCIERQI